MFKLTYLLATATLLLNSSFTAAYAADKPFNIKPIIKPIESFEPPQQLLNTFKPIDINTQMLELHGLGKTREVNTETLELHGFKPGPREVNTATLELHGIVGTNKSAAVKEVNTATLELHGLKSGTKEVYVIGTLELHGKSKSTETSISQKRMGMSAPPTMQGNATQGATKIVPATVLPSMLSKDKPIDPNIIKQNSTPEPKIVVNQAPISGTKNIVIANKIPEIKSIIPAPVVVQNTPPASAFDKAGYKRDADRKLGSLWLSKCSGIDCKRDMQKIIDTRITEVLDKADKAVDLRNPVLLNNLENQMDAKFNPQMQQLLDKDKPAIRLMPKPIKINPNSLKL